MNRLSSKRVPPFRRGTQQQQQQQHNRSKIKFLSSLPIWVQVSVQSSPLIRLSCRGKKSWILKCMNVFEAFKSFAQWRTTLCTSKSFIQVVIYGLIDAQNFTIGQLTRGIWKEQSNLIVNLKVWNFLYLFVFIFLWQKNKERNKS